MLLTDAELDHTLGLVALRQTDEIHVYSTHLIHQILDSAGLTRMLAAYVDVTWHDVQTGVPFELHAHDGTTVGLRCEAIALGTGRLPRYARPQDGGANAAATAVVAYRIVDSSSGLAAVLMPSAPSFPVNVVDGAVQVLLLDGTFWADDEMGDSDPRSIGFGHIPLSGTSGTLATVRELRSGGGPRVIYTHFNNTNPVLANSGQYRLLVDSGAEVAYDGMEIWVGNQPNPSPSPTQPVSEERNP